MKIAVFSYFGMEAAPVAYKLLSEGHEVLFGQIQDQKDTLIDEEKKTKRPEDPKDKKMRLKVYDGALKKIPAKQLYQYLIHQKDKRDWYVFTDSNLCFKYTELLMAQGFQGHFPMKEDRELEVDRAKAKEFVKKNYPDVKIAETKEFKKAEDGIAFLQESDKVYVLKSQGDSGGTVVPDDDVDAAREQIIDSLKKEKKDYEQMGFILEEKIIDPVEITPEIVFYNGEPVFTVADIENKPRGAGNLGPQSGCAQNLIFQTELDDEINKMAFPPVVYEMAKKRKGYFVWDASLLFDKKGTPYFGEFCSNRLGWDAFPTELAMAESVSSFFEKVVKGENPFKYEYGAGVRVFDTPTGNGFILDEPLIVDDEKGIYLYDVHKKETWMSVGGGQDLAVATGAGTSIERAVENAYDAIKNIHFKEAIWRPDFDFMSRDYKTSIINRLSFGRERGMF